MDYFGQDEILWPICLTCAELLAACVPGKSPRVTALTQLFAAHLVEQYTSTVAQMPVYRSGLPIHQLRKVQDYVAAHLAEEISIEALAALVRLSSSHFAHIFKEFTGMAPLQFVTRQRITQAEQSSCPGSLFIGRKVLLHRCGALVSRQLPSRVTPPRAAQSIFPSTDESTPEKHCKRATRKK